MPCYHPLDAFILEDGSVSFKHNHPLIHSSIQLPCGRCIGCRLQRSYDWAVRATHEASFHEKNCFLTLTYDAEHLPEDLSVSVRELQLFFKRLRKHLQLTPIKFRYLACGEYGEKLSRPHYHVCLFGFDFDDKKLFQASESKTTYTSDLLSKLWGKGHCLIGEFNYKTASYTAQYVLKKIGGQQAKQHYTVVNYKTGELIELKPEFLVMSRKPGLGAGWIEKFGKQVLHHDAVVIEGKKRPVPRYYEKKLDLQNGLKLEANKFKRAEDTISRADSSSERLATKEKVTLARQKLKTRNYER